MLDTLSETLAAAGIDTLPATLLADAGYFSEDNAAATLQAGIDPVFATGRLRHGQAIPPAPRGRITAAATPKQRMARKARTKKGKADYARRKAIVEPVFGQIQTCQDGGRLRLRGKANADIEWHLHLFCHNIRKLFGSGQLSASSAPAEDPGGGRVLPSPTVQCPPPAPESVPGGLTRTPKPAPALPGVFLAQQRLPHCIRVDLTDTRS